MERGRRNHHYQAQRQLSISEMIAMLDVQSLLIDAPSTSVRQTIDVERLEDEIVSGLASLPGSPAISAGVGTASNRLTAAFSDYDTVSEQVYHVMFHSQTERNTASLSLFAEWRDFR